MKKVAVIVGVVGLLLLAMVMRGAYTSRGHLGVDPESLPDQTIIVGPASNEARTRLVIQRSLIKTITAVMPGGPPEPEDLRALQKWGRDNREDRPNVSVQEVVLGDQEAISYQLAGANTDCLIFSIHGGGYVGGHPLNHYNFTVNTMEALGCNAIAPFYPLAPEQPYPAGLDAVVAAYLATKEDNPNKRIVLTGESAGGGMAAALMLRLKAAGVDQPNIAILHAPWVDLTGSAETLKTHAHRDSLPVPSMSRWASYYADEMPLNDLFVSPLFGDLSGLPPILIFVGTDEVQLGDALNFQAKLLADGVYSELQIWRSLWHIWFNAAPEEIPEIDKTKQAIATFYNKNK